MKFLENGEPEENSLIKKNAEPVLPENNPELQSKGLISYFRDLLAKIRGFTLEDIKRMKEAGVSMVVEEAEIKKATVKKIIAEAKKLMQKQWYSMRKLKMNIKMLHKKNLNVVIVIYKLI